MKWVVLGAAVAVLCAPAATSVAAHDFKPRASSNVYSVHYNGWHWHSPWQDSILSMDRVIVVLQNRGYSDLAGFYDRGDCYVGQARHPNGYRVSLRVDRRSGDVIGTVRLGRGGQGYDGRKGPGKWSNSKHKPRHLPEWQRRKLAKRMLLNRGFSHIQYLRKRGDTFVFRATGPRGHRVKIWVHEYSRAIVGRKRL